MRRFNALTFSLIALTGTCTISTSANAASSRVEGTVTAASPTPPVVRFEDLIPSFKGKNPGIAGVLGSQLIVSASSADHGEELWRTDGTKSGTGLLKDIFPGPKGSKLLVLGLLGSNIYFDATDNANGAELWKSDGTPEGTVLVKDINPGPGSGFGKWTGNSVVGQEVMYFAADDGVHGAELWKSDGTPEGTVLVKDINPGSAFTDIRDLRLIGNTAIFVVTGNGPGLGLELWRSDGTEIGTFPLIDTSSFPSATFIGLGDVVGNNMFLNINDGVRGSELWKTDGTVSGTLLVKEIFPGKEDGMRSTAYGFSNHIYFIGYDPITGGELWKSDGTPEGTVMVKDINPGKASSTPINYTVSSEALYFLADDGTHGAELWKTSGTAEGTVLVQDMNPGKGDSEAAPFSANRFIFASVDDGARGREPWIVNYPGVGTRLLRDIRKGPGHSDAGLVAAVGDTVYFTANEGTGIDVLWVLNPPQPALVTRSVAPGVSQNLKSLIKPVSSSPIVWKTSGGCKIKGSKLISRSAKGTCTVTAAQTVQTQVRTENGVAVNSTRITRKVTLKVARK